MIVSPRVRRNLEEALLKSRAATPAQQFAVVRAMVNMGLSWPYDGEELNLAKAVGKAAHGPFYHGGPIGLSEIRPSGETKKTRFASDKLNLGNRSIHYASYKKNFAFFATSIAEARSYAIQCASGVVYQVQPCGDVLPDMEYFRPVYLLSEIPGTAFNACRNLLPQEDFVAALASKVSAYCAAYAKVIEVTK